MDAILLPGYCISCELWDDLPPSQPVRTLVLACPGVDAIRFWPLPVQQPWEKDEKRNVDLKSGDCSNFHIIDKFSLLYIILIYL
jgi:hypothetical protein